MNVDPTEPIRRQEVAEINVQPGSRKELEKRHGQVWDTKQMIADFEVVAFLAPYVEVRRRSDGACGTLRFQHEPRFYFDWKEAR